MDINQYVCLYAAKPGPDREIMKSLESGHLAWIQVARGSVTLNGQILKEDDGAAITGKSNLILKARQRPKCCCLTSK